MKTLRFSSACTSTARWFIPCETRYNADGPWRSEFNMFWSHGYGESRSVVEPASINLLVRFTRGMDGLLGVAGIFIHDYYGSLPHSLCLAPVNPGWNMNHHYLGRTLAFPHCKADQRCTFLVFICRRGLPDRWLDSLGSAGVENINYNVGPP